MTVFHILSALIIAFSAPFHHAPIPTVTPASVVVQVTPSITPTPTEFTGDPSIDETPTIATVSDITKLQGQPFFAKAQNGDKVYVYSNAKKAILYRPSENKIIEETTYAVFAPTPTPTPVTAELSNDSYYQNSAGNEVHSPAYSNSVPAGASAICGDGTYSFSQSRRGTCSSHGGVSEWL